MPQGFFFSCTEGTFNFSGYDIRTRGCFCSKPVLKVHRWRDIKSPLNQNPPPVDLRSVQSLAAGDDKRFKTSRCTNKDSINLWIKPKSVCRQQACASITSTSRLPPEISIVTWVIHTHAKHMKTQSWAMGMWLVNYYWLMLSPLSGVRLRCLLGIREETKAWLG